DLKQDRALRYLHSFPTRRSSDLLFKPFVMRELVRRDLATNIKNAKNKIERLDESIWDVLEDVIRAPSTIKPCTNITQTWYPSVRSEEHTSELQSRIDLVCRLLLD